MGQETRITMSQMALCRGRRQVPSSSGNHSSHAPLRRDVMWLWVSPLFLSFLFFGGGVNIHMLLFPDFGWMLDIAGFLLLGVS